MAKVTRGALGEAPVLSEFTGFDHDHDRGSSIVNFLRTLSPGIGVVLQYNDRPPAFGVFQGFQGGNVILTNYNGFPGLVRIAANRVNAVSPWTGGFGGFGVF